MRAEVIAEGLFRTASRMSIFAGFSFVETAAVAIELTINEYFPTAEDISYTFSALLPEPAVDDETSFTPLPVDFPEMSPTVTVDTTLPFASSNSMNGAETATP